MPSVMYYMNKGFHKLPNVDINIPVLARPISHKICNKNKISSN